MRHKSSSGFALISAVFILAILGMVSAFIVNISGITFRTTSYALEGARAFYAARSGLEWGIYQVVNNPAACPATTTLNLTEGGASGFTVTVSCTSTSYTEGVSTFNVFTLSSAAQRGAFGSTDYVSRNMQVSVTLSN